MAILTSDEAREMGRNELEERLDDLNLELAKERGQIAVGGFPEDPGRISEIRRTIARIKTVLHEQQSGKPTDEESSQTAVRVGEQGER
ncbi:MAG: 50S ribosomal protein L29 [Candidatus Nanohaloarchaea archaeon]|nr:50S ribosomal protein L29 [Candidatus Nanohaloarchaea archaeon]